MIKKDKHLEKIWKKKMICIQCGKIIEHNKRVVVGLNGYGPFCCCLCYRKEMIQQARWDRGFMDSEEFFDYYYGPETTEMS